MIILVLKYAAFINTQNFTAYCECFLCSLSKLYPHQYSFTLDVVEVTCMALHVCLCDFYKVVIVHTLISTYFYMKKVCLLKKRLMNASEKRDVRASLACI